MTDLEFTVDGTEFTKELDSINKVIGDYTIDVYYKIGMYDKNLTIYRVRINKNGESSGSYHSAVVPPYVSISVPYGKHDLVRCHKVPYPNYVFEIIGVEPEGRCLTFDSFKINETPFTLNNKSGCSTYVNGSIYMSGGSYKRRNTKKTRKTMRKRKSNRKHKHSMKRK